MRDCRFAALLVLVGIGLPVRSDAQAASARAQISTLIGGEASTINAARTAAKQGRNSEAAMLFARAIHAVPGRRAELLREYADALLYSKQPRLAAPLYRELLASADTPAESQTALLRQLATALTWGSQYQAALPMYDRLCWQLPDDTELALRRARVLVALGRRDDAVAALGRLRAARWASGAPGRLGDEVLVEAAKGEARAGRSAAAVRLFDQAMAHNPALRPTVLRDYADQLAALGRNDPAIRAYREFIDHAAAGPERDGALAALAKVYERAGRPREAYAVYLASIKNAAPAAATSAQPAGFAPTIQRLMTAAQLAAAAGYQAASASLLQRVSSDCAGCSGQLLLANADRLVRMNPHGAAVLYRNALTKLPRPSASYMRAQRGLATALTNVRMAAAAVDAWSAYLALAPRDGPAVLQRARLLASLHRDDDALLAYKSAVALNPRDIVARRGVVDQTIVLARAVARSNQNAQSAALFSTAIGLDGARRREWLREYADQLSFSGRAADAIPLYQEAREDSSQSAADRRQTMIGLANAYAWTDRLDAAAAIYGQLEQAYPQDQDIRWSRLVFAAKKAAQTNDNRRSADLFGQALALKPDTPPDIRRQYADQLSFTNRAGSAVAIYRTVLSSPGLTAADRLAAQQGLAQAYGWAGQQAEANALYKELALEHPGDQSLYWHLLVGQARVAAKNDQNAASAKLFAQAIKAQPGRSGQIAREYADQLSFSGRSAGAVVLYRQILNEPKLADDERTTTERSLARALDWSGAYGEARLAYANLVKRFPGEVALKRSLLIVSAHEAGATNHNEEAAGYLAKALAVDPSKRADILANYADQLTFAHKAKAAVPLYRELLANDRLPADARRHALGLARALAWSDQPMAAYGEYKRLVVLDPEDLEAEGGMARMLSWAGRHAEAATAYRAILTRHPDDPATMRGLAETEDWQGHHRAAQTILTRRLAIDPSDLEARRLLAQSNIWSGRPDKAMTELRRAMAPRSSIPNSRIASSAIAKPDQANDGTGR